MAKFLDTTGVSHYLSEMIKKTKTRLILISPYLQLNDKIKLSLEDLILRKIDVRIIYREDKLAYEEKTWLENQLGLRTSLLNSLHAKCYLNENEAIITSMNLYTYSKENNHEMGIYVRREDDLELYNDIVNEANGILRISKELKTIVKTVDSDKEDLKALKKKKIRKSNKDLVLLTTKELSLESGFSSRKVNDWFVSEKLMYKDDEGWNLTKKGKTNGGVEKKGSYGRYIMWSEEFIVDLIEDLE